MTKQAQSFSAQVWDVLSHIDVTDYCDTMPATAKRPQVTYLPWHKGWSILKKHFPASVYNHEPDTFHADGTVEVEVLVSIRGDSEDDHQFSSARLAVMDRYFNAIQNPSARQINDSRQRALVKALAFAGLGLNLWDDTMVPVGKQTDPVNTKQAEKLFELMEAAEADVEAFLQWAGVEQLEDMPAAKFPTAVAMLEAKIRKLSAEKEAAE